MGGQGAPPPPEYTPTGKPVYLYTQRTPPEGVLISIAVFERPQTAGISVPEWLVSGYYPSDSHPDRATIEGILRDEGDISTALARAYAGRTRFLTYRETRKAAETVYEIGAVLPRGKVTYTTYFTRDGLYVYSVSLDLPLNDPPGAFKDSDSLFIDTYERMVSSFAFID